MKKVIFTLLILTLVLCGCSNKSSNKDTSGESMLKPFSNNVDNKLNANETIKNSTSIDNFEWAAIPADIRERSSIAFNIKTVNDQIGITVLRFNKYFYSVHKIKNSDGVDGYGFILYKDSLVYDGWFVIKLSNKTRFLDIKNGKTTINDIKKYDLSTILLEPSDGNDGQSYHRFLDGTVAIVDYKNVNGILTVSNFRIEKDPTDFVHLLLPIDLDLIK